MYTSSVPLAEHFWQSWWPHMKFWKNMWKMSRPIRGQGGHVGYWIAHKSNKTSWAFLANRMPEQASLISYLYNKIKKHFRTPRGTFVRSLVTCSFQDFFFISGNQKQVLPMAAMLFAWSRRILRRASYTLFIPSHKIYRLVIMKISKFPAIWNKMLFSRYIRNEVIM